MYTNIANQAPKVNGKKTAYARIEESHCNSASGTLAYGKLRVKFYSDASYSKLVGQTNIMCLYSWPNGARSVEDIE